MTTDERERLRAAAEQLRANWYDVYGCTAEGLSPECKSDVNTVSFGVLALLGPADDGEPVTEEWLISMGGRIDPGVPGFVGLPCGGAYLWFHRDGATEIKPRIEWDGVYLPGEYRTRRAVRRLLAALTPEPT